MSLTELVPTVNDLAIELIAGAIGAVALAGTAAFIQYFRRIRLERLYPVSGEYLSFFEDIENGKRIVMPSTSTLTQKGDRVSIKTMLESGRSWSMSGRIIRGGHITGVYEADPIYDEGIGSFYLKISRDSMDGIWSGYDSENRDLNSGLYWFRKKYSAEIRSAKPSDKNEILHTSNNAFGSGYISAEQIAADAKRFSLVAEFDGVFVGFCFGHIAEPNSITDLIAQSGAVLPDDVREADKSGKLGIIKSIAVKRSARGHGLADQLFKAAEEELRNRGVECIVVPAWKMNDGVPMQSILERYDYSQWLETEDYWRGKGEEGSYECAICGQDCRCSAIFYRKGRI